MTRVRWFGRDAIALAICLIVATVGTVGARAADPAPAIDGVYVLDTQPQIVTGRLETAEQGTPDALKLDVMFRRVLEQNALKRYDSFGARGMRWTIVSDDLQTLVDRQIVTVLDGHAQGRAHFPKPGRYHLFAEGQPRAIPRQVLRFDLDVDPPFDPPTPRALGGPITEARVGPYRLAFDTLDLEAGHDVTLTLHIRENDKPARDLRPVNGYAAEVTMISVADLHWTEVTELRSESARDETTEPADIGFQIHRPPAGTYRLFVTFAGPRLGFTAGFVAVVRPPQH